MEKPVNKRYPSVKKTSDPERIAMVKEIFSTITEKYDFLNHFLSLRRDVAWRKFTARKMLFPGTKKMLDVACGTGDLSIIAAKRHNGLQIIGIDFVRAMLDIGKVKIGREGLKERIALTHGDALLLPLRDNIFDVVTMAFGIRNIPDREGALKEMVRVCAPGGQIMVLEMTFMRKRIFKPFYYFYLNFLLPRIARRFSTNPAAYHYLADSIMNFPTPDEFLLLMEKCGMKNTEKHSLTFGATYLYVGRKPENTTR